MATITELLEARGEGREGEAQWLQEIISDWSLLADLSLTDLVLWLPDENDVFIAAAQIRPTSAATLFYRDIIGQSYPDRWKNMIRTAYSETRIVNRDMMDVSSAEHPSHTNIVAIPVVHRKSNSGVVTKKTLGVITSHSNLAEEAPGTSRQEEVFKDCAKDLFRMVSDGTYPESGAPEGPRRGAPRASDGLIRLDAAGIVTFASPNALSAFKRLGYSEELEGESLAEVGTSLHSNRLPADESLPLVTSGRAPWRTDLEVDGITVSLRSVTLRYGAERIGAIVLCRDVTELRKQEQELLSKDATIREIHHRVKNNLQTVSSLLRMQARSAVSPEARDDLNHAQRRVAAIAVVHDTLSQGLTQNVNFDDVFNRTMQLVGEVAATGSAVIRPEITGSFGILPSEYATPLALALTELVTNAIEHGIGKSDSPGGKVNILVDRDEERMVIEVNDDGAGIPEEGIGDGLGTRIVRTLIEGELGGSIVWKPREEGGTKVIVTMPLKWIKQKKK